QNERDAYAPLVWQCRYSGIEVPDELWQYKEFGRGKPYGENQAEHMALATDVFEQFDDWTERFVHFVLQKGKVRPNEYRAYGYEAPKHTWADMKLAWREFRMKLGYPPLDSSPARQQALNLNRDV